MRGRAGRIFVVGFLASFGILFGAWVVVDSLAHIDEFLGAAGPGRNWLMVAVDHYQNVISLHGLTMIEAVTLASIGFGGMASRRFVGSRSRAAG